MYPSRAQLHVAALKNKQESKKKGRVGAATNPSSPPSSPPSSTYGPSSPLAVSSRHPHAPVASSTPSPKKSKTTERAFTVTDVNTMVNGTKKVPQLGALDSNGRDAFLEHRVFLRRQRQQVQKEKKRAQEVRLKAQDENTVGTLMVTRQARTFAALSLVEEAARYHRDHPAFEPGQRDTRTTPVLAIRNKPKVALRDPKTHLAVLLDVKAIMNAPIPAPLPPAEENTSMAETKKTHPSHQAHSGPWETELEHAARMADHVRKELALLNLWEQ